MRLILNQAGYKEVQVDKKGGKWHISNPEVLSPQYTKKRYAMFDSDRDRTKVLLQLYNGEFEALPAELQEQLRGAKVAGNVWGEFLRVFMITQSGAEGISLKNVRKVLIMEPFWNMVRMDQVIGRAVRTGSHQELPPEERTVEVYTFVSTFTDAQLKSNFTLKREDNGLTSDAYIMQIAESKNQIIQSFLDQMKMASVDCRAHAATNKLTTQGIKCYAFPIPVDDREEAFVPILEKDALRKSSLVRKKKVQGKVVSIQGKKYVIVEEYPQKLFDYHAYKDAGVLSEALIL
jgi:archaellin